MLHTRSKTNNINTLNNPNCLQPQPLLKVSIPAFLKAAQFSSLESVTSLQTVYPSITFAQKTFSLTSPMSVYLPVLPKAAYTIYPSCVSRSQVFCTLAYCSLTNLLGKFILQNPGIKRPPGQATRAINTTPKDLQVVPMFFQVLKGATD